MNDKELEILRNAVDLTEKTQKRRRLQNPEIIKIVEIVEEFITKKKTYMLWRYSY